MALKPVQDPALLAALNAPETPAAPAGPKPVTDPALLAQLNAPEAPASPEQEMIDRVPLPTDQKPTGEPAERGVMERVADFTGISRDPVLEMAAHGLTSIAKGAPEVIGNSIGNFGVQASAGLSAPFVGTDVNDQANYIDDFTEQHSMRPQGESAKFLTEGLGEAFAPVQKIKQAVGEATLDATGSPAAATGMEMLPDFLAALAGGPPIARAGKSLPERPLAPDPVVNPKVEQLRAADIRMRPSDVRAMTPNPKTKVPGEFREKFADGPDMKKDMTLHNQQRLTDIAAEDIGVKSLDEASLTTAKQAPGATYDMVESVLMDKPMSEAFQDVFREAAASAKLPKGEASSVTRIIGALRRRAAKRMQNDQVATEEAGFADRELADRLEEAMGEELGAIGEPQLLGEYRSARQQFAKIHDIETATRAGHIDANVVHKLGKKGVKLSGGLKLVADASEHAPNVTQHSLKTAARQGDEIEGSREGLIKRGVKSVVRKIPGMDVGSEGFQNTLGKVDPARTSYYGRDPDVAPARGPEQPDLDLREALELDAPPGEVGMLPRAPRELGSQTDMLGEAFEFGRPPGEVGIPPDAQISLQELLGLGEPLAMKQPPGRVGKPKRRE